MKPNQQVSTKLLTPHREVDILSDDFVPDIKEVIQALPKINRYNGNTEFPYSVACHSMACMEAAMLFEDIHEPHKLLAILLHDAAEAYIGDIVRPIKNIFLEQPSGIDLVLLEYKILYSLFDKQVHDPKHYFELLSPEFSKIMSDIDDKVCKAEIEYFFPWKDLSEDFKNVPSFNVIFSPITLHWREQTDLFSKWIKELSLGVVPIIPCSWWN